MGYVVFERVVRRSSVWFVVRARDKRIPVTSHNKNYSNTGTFSEDYVQRAELLCDNKDETKKSWMMLSLLVGVVAPMVSVVPFVFGLEKDGADDPSRNGLMVSSVWLGVLAVYVENVCFPVSIALHTKYLFAVTLRHCYFMQRIMPLRRFRSEDTWRMHVLQERL